MLLLLILYYRKQINYDLSDCLHASVTELRHICISKRWGSKLALMKAAKVNINQRILSTLWFFALLHLSSLRWDKKMWNTSPVPIQWAKPHDATKMPQLLCVKLEDRKNYIPDPEAITCCHIPACGTISYKTSVDTLLTTCHSVWPPSACSMCSKRRTIIFFCRGTLGVLGKSSRKQRHVSMFLVPVNRGRPLLWQPPTLSFMQNFAKVRYTVIWGILRSLKLTPHRIRQSNDSFLFTIHIGIKKNIG